MSPGVRAVRDAQAQERLLAAAKTLAERFGFVDQHAALAAASVGPAARDPSLVALFQREAMADLLEGLVQATAPGAAMPTDEQRLSSMTVAHVRDDLIAEADAPALDDLERIETAGSNRKTVLAAIEKRRKELAAGTEAA